MKIITPLKCTLLSLALLCRISVAAGPDPTSQPPGLSVRDGMLFKDGMPYRGVGANYFDLFLRVLADPANRTSLEGLQQLSRSGIPFVRFALAFNSRQWSVYREKPETYFARLDTVFREAERLNIGLIPSFFWTPDLPDLVDEHRDAWGDPASQTTQLMRRIIADFMGRYRHSPALWGYEFGNETNLSADLPNALQFRKKGGTERDDLKSTHMATMFSEFAQAIRAHDPSRPIFSGNSHSRASSWHNTSERSWKPDTREQAFEILKRDNPASLDTLSIHLYADEGEEAGLGAWTTGREDYLKAVRGLADTLRRPLFVGEFGLANKPDAQLTRSEFEKLLATMESAGVDLAAFWVFDLKNQEPAWSVTHSNARSYMIELVAEANRRWNRTAQSGRIAKP